MTETFDREAIQRVRAFLEHNAHGVWKSVAPFLVHYDAMAEALAPLSKIAEAFFYDGRGKRKPDDEPVWGFDGKYITVGDLRRARAVLEAYASQKEPGE